MKCSTCYAENPAWSTICSECGEQVRSIRLCPAGHILGPEDEECTVCPDLWPEISAFVGPPVLRGVLWCPNGSLRLPSGSGRTVAMDLRDDAIPINLKERVEGELEVLPQDDPVADAKVLVRPDGLGVCLSFRLSRSSEEPTYQKVGAASSLAIGSTRIAIVRFDVPEWVEEA